MRRCPIVLLLFALLAWPPSGLAEPMPRAPEFTRSDAAAWLNSPPLRLEDLRGQVLLVEFWTFGCINCVRSIPWIKALEERYRNAPFLVIGVHTPEFSHERPAAAVSHKMRELGIRHPVMLDNDYAYWNAMGNRYWPAFYLIDKQGRLRHAQAGEVRSGSVADAEMRRWIERLLREEPAAVR